MKIVVVVPTYNESENIGKFIDALLVQFDAVKSENSENNCHILVVDGNSPDGTAQIVEQKQKNSSRVHLLLEKKKNGLGAAYIYGFKHAMDELKADVLVEMDADFQHDPEDFPKLIREINNGYDYVIGSRFTKGGSIPEDWAFYRKLLSIGGSFFSKVVLGIFNINDFTGGFKASRVSVVRKIKLDEVLSGGFAYKIDLLFKMHRAGAKIKEVPIKFGLRDRGDSKMEGNNFADSLRVVLMLRLNEKKSFVKFIIVGFAGLFMDTATFNIVRHSMLSSDLAVVPAGLLGMLTTFILNNYWSFGDRELSGKDKKFGKPAYFVLYFLISFVPILVRKYLVRVGTYEFGDTFIVSNIAFFIGIAFGLVWNYTMYSRVIWKKH